MNSELETPKAEIHPLVADPEFAKNIIEIRNIEVGEGHTVSAVMWGKKPEEGKPVKYTFLFHGGPGTPPDETHFEMFDKDVDTVIVIYQRGVPPSSFDPSKDETWTAEDETKYPSPALKNNTTDRLITDVNKVADNFGIKKANIAAGSWGTTVALGVAAHNSGPETDLEITGMVLWGILPGSDAYYDKMISAENRLIHAPDEYARLIECLSEEFKLRHPDILDRTKQPPHYREILQDLYQTVNQIDKDGNPTPEAKAVAARFALFQYKLAEAVDPLDNESREVKEILASGVANMVTGEDAFGIFALKYPDVDLLEQAKLTLYYTSQGNFLTQTGNEPMDPANLLRIAKIHHIRLIGCSDDHNTPASNANELGAALISKGASDLQNDYIDGAGHIRTDRLLAQRLKKHASELPTHGLYQEAA